MLTEYIGTGKQTHLRSAMGLEQMTPNVNF